MPFLTEELWQRLERPGKSIALEPYPKEEDFPSEGEEEIQREAEEMGTVQVESIRRQIREQERFRNIVTATRSAAAEAKIDRSQKVSGQVCCKPDILFPPTLRFDNFELEVVYSETPKLDGAVRSTPDFDLVLNLPKVNINAERLRKENADLEKVISNSKRQLENEEIIRKMPEKVVATLRSKLSSYEAQLEKNLVTLKSEQPKSLMDSIGDILNQS